MRTRTRHHFQGADVTEVSSELIHYGDMHKINSGGWHQERMFFLFDHQLIYCKKVRATSCIMQLQSEIEQLACTRLCAVLKPGRLMTTLVSCRIYCGEIFSFIAAALTLTSVTSKT